MGFLVHGPPRRRALCPKSIAGFQSGLGGIGGIGARDYTAGLFLEARRRRTY
jgi:hypothetical protein